ncbi:TPA: helix-turn-helix transcriptional regulator, partial [Pseudomonas aeruginosa]|nr:helix-turn-helix transcriptional regulator [Pseudomonas aeruginosa]
DATGISRATLSRIANTPGYNTSTDHIDLLCDYLECELSDLLKRVAN